MKQLVSLLKKQACQAVKNTSVNESPSKLVFSKKTVREFIFYLSCIS